jgi:hypothetical protein
MSGGLGRRRSGRKWKSTRWFNVCNSSNTTLPPSVFEVWNSRRLLHAARMGAAECDAS